MIADRIWESRERTFVEEKNGETVMHTTGIAHLGGATAGALIARDAWIAAGRVSSRDPQALFQIQRHSEREPDRHKGSL